MKSLQIGDTACLLADDPAAVVDVPHFCVESGHELVEMTEAEGHQAYLVRKAK